MTGVSLTPEDCSQTRAGKTGLYEFPVLCCKKEEALPSLRCKILLPPSFPPPPLPFAAQFQQWSQLRAEPGVPGYELSALHSGLSRAEASTGISCFILKGKGNIFCSLFPWHLPFFSLIRKENSVAPLFLR